ncbi:MAG: tRNA ((37)-N6)-threonylcarbamoyltransferase complex dimerization subunit type 1 TsaB [Verrucomicrobiota bacterium]|jgi:tRNA threonylcarbamoyl adenosine modification protein YeaZ
MKTLALEFSSSRRSVAVLDGDSILAEQGEAGGELVPPLTLVERTLAAARVARGAIECVVVGLGPGSYTGIRGAIALAQGWQLANGVKLLGVDSATAVAAQARSEKISGDFCVVIDAQRGEFYVAGSAPEQVLRLVTADEMKLLAASGALLVGPEVTKWFPGAREIFPTASALGLLAANRTDFVAGENLEPVYLRATTFVKAAPARVI